MFFMGCKSPHKDRNFQEIFDLSPDRPWCIGRIARQHGSDYLIHAGERHVSHFSRK
jgi:hypothetical protein